jgi:hypothetical protein
MSWPLPAFLIQPVRRCKRWWETRKKVMEGTAHLQHYSYWRDCRNVDATGVDFDWDVDGSTFVG